ncbi:hypothetical protein RND81_13G069500 [Saponaria officinalis]|uniref:Tyrosine-specific transport protein n=1 Tax=Saponaria officinalis TaxID=3572 RepID=A0AAW1H188_SAPOF
MQCHHSIHKSITTSHLTQLNIKVNRQLNPRKPPFSIHHHPSICSKHSNSTFSKITNSSFSSSFTAKYYPFNRNHTNETTSTSKCFATDGNECSKQESKSFWGAVSLIIGTAVGPGMLGLPAATTKSGPLPSTIAILLSWVYVISSIILVAELSFATMEEDGVKEVSFTGLPTKAFGAQFGAFVSVVYASLSFSLLVACVSGIGSIVSQWFPNMNTLASHSLFPLLLGSIIWFFPFETIDTTNRFLCFMMLVSIITLVGIGVSFARSNLVASFGNVSWNVLTILPAIPVTVLTLGFHVITPFICKVAGDTVNDARKAILVGGTVPLVMVLSWNLIVLGLSGTGKAQSSFIQTDPIKLLLSVKSSALFAVQGFAFSALATSFIGYAVSFPKQLIDTLELIFRRNNPKTEIFEVNGTEDASNESISSRNSCKWNLRGLISAAVLVVPILVASFYPSTFSKALDFAGVYANCFLFGVLPPAMAYIFKSRGKLRSSLPGGNLVLFLLFSIAIILSIWH